MQKWRNDDRPIEWCAKMMTDILNGGMMTDMRKNGGMTAIDTDMRYRSIEWCTKMAE